ncbi:hypothetical protein [Actinoplanes siamensis]|uniref:Uncharacterized protein n=1 Tax=Actinoplanes siamensis TaxID=1223317 RepID=A0A919NC78_9ACTN|nr:hypothetical protein [Actinoplanes siamensis]GIF08441.1 hypothetical protein Asi03nite_59790 [Actinoplanes siamensis]
MPIHRQCRDAAAAEGVAELRELPAGTVLCVRTSKEATARLTVKKIDKTQQSVTFDATVWGE